MLELWCKYNPQVAMLARGNLVVVIAIVQISAFLMIQYWRKPRRGDATVSQLLTRFLVRLYKL